jgi:hypothetical protein
MKQLAKKLKSKPKRKAGKLGGIDLGFKKSKPRKNTRRRTRRYALQEIAMKKKKSKR